MEEVFLEVGHGSKDSKENMKAKAALKAKEAVEDTKPMMKNRSAEDEFSISDP